MTIKIYNTLTRKKQPLQPLQENLVKLYVCGITSYDYCHIGHARSALVFDMVVRYLRFCGKQVIFVRNFTDIDDKIIARAAERGVDAGELARRFIGEFHTDMEALGVLKPDVEPRVTDHVGDIVELIKELIDKGLAYPAGGDVYYRVAEFPEYGMLSGRNLDDMQAGARVTINEAKENPLDFALWKLAKKGEPKWTSPWGEGRPGWHIECSAMARKYFGDTFDIHGGGKDLIFPHHENEIAQSCGVSGKPMAGIWMHHGFVTIKDEKMSKSIGNFLTIRDILRDYSPEALRLFLFFTQYRNPLDFTESGLDDAGVALDRLYECLSLLSSLPAGKDGITSGIPNKDNEKLQSLRGRFCRAMDNDFNTAHALGFLFDAVKVINKLVRLLPAQPSKEDISLLEQAGRDLRELAGIMGLAGQDAVSYMKQKKENLLADISLSVAEIEEMIALRNEARDRKDWSGADAARDRLIACGIELQDRSDGTSWSVVSSS
jgi:cysteinyl-tRNA synthetase